MCGIWNWQSKIQSWPDKMLHITTVFGTVTHQFCARFLAPKIDKYEAIFRPKYFKFLMFCGQDFSNFDVTVYMCQLQKIQ